MGEGNDRILVSHRDRVRDTDFETTSDNTFSGSDEPTPGAVAVPAGGPQDPPRQQMAWDSSVLLNDEEDGSAENMSLPTACLALGVNTTVDVLEQEKIQSKAEKDVRERILSTAVQAVEEDSYNRATNRRRMVLMAVLAVVVIVGVVAITLVVVFQTRPSPTQAPTFSPEQSVPPTNIGPPVFLFNQGCESALELDSNLVGDTRGSTIDSLIDNVATTCPPFVRENGKGVWYKMVGDGSHLVSSTCENTLFDTQISVFSGKACDLLHCVAGNDQGLICGNDGAQSRVSWYAETGVSYYIFVHGSRSAVGRFSMKLERLEDNDSCDNAISLELDKEIFGSTRGFTIDDTVPTCDNARLTAPGVWYRYSGPKGPFELSDLSIRIETGAYGFRTQVALYEGSCDSLQCLTVPSIWGVTESVEYYILVTGLGIEVGDFVITKPPQPTLPPIGGSELPLPPFGGGISPPPPDGSDLAPIEPPTPPQPTQPIPSPPSPGCYCYIPIEWYSPSGLPGKLANITISGTTAALLLCDDIPLGETCGNLVLGTAPGIWYHVIGSGGPIKASTCATTSGFDTQISVFSGDCWARELRCVDGNDQFCGDQSSVSWFSEVSVSYYVLVHGFGSREGKFNLTIEHVGVDVSANCEEAIPVETSAVSILGSIETVAGTSPVWYSILGAGRDLTASTCHGSANFASEVTVFSGKSCNQLDRVDVVVSPCGIREAVTWPSIKDALYYIKIEESGEDEVTSRAFVWTVEEAPINDRCLSAIGPLPVDGTWRVGSTRSATLDSVDSCGDVSLGPGLWYFMIGTGDVLTASTCSGFTDFETHISVYAGGCGSLQCAEKQSHKSCGSQSTVKWASREGERYYILVHGATENERGTFQLAITMENDFCVGASELVIGDPVTTGSTIGATHDSDELFRPNGRCAEVTDSRSPGVWYMVVGRGGRLVASTCNPETDFDTVIAVFLGSCGELVCEDSNDNACGRKASVVTWNALLGEDYFIFVFGYGVGRFGLTVVFEQ